MKLFWLSGFAGISDSIFTGWPDGPELCDGGVTKKELEEALNIKAYDSYGLSEMLEA